MKSTVAFLVRKMAVAIDSTIKFTTKSHYGGPELVYVVSNHKEPLQELTGSRTLTPRHIKALKELGFAFFEQRP